MARRVSRMEGELEEYRVRSNRLTEFVYALKLANVNVDELYRRTGKESGVGNSNSNGREGEEEGVLRRGELREEELIVSGS